VLLPALNPDVSIIHVHQADIYGNARVFGTGIAHVECALASKKVILSAEEIVETDEFRRDPGRTSIPHFVVDAVVHAPFGAYPGTVQGRYSSDPQHVVECFGAMMQGSLKAYLDKWVYSVSSHEEMLEKRIGWKKLQELQRRETIREGYSV
jgi:glutaconate CoA-transferase subunit A